MESLAEEGDSPVLMRVILDIRVGRNTRNFV